MKVFREIMSWILPIVIVDNRTARETVFLFIGES